MSTNYDTIDDVKLAFAEGKIESGEAIEILQEDFDISEDDAIDMVKIWPIQDDDEEDDEDDEDDKDDA